MSTRCGADLYPGSCQRRTKPGQQCWQHRETPGVLVINRSREQRMMQQFYDAWPLERRAAYWAEFAALAAARKLARSAGSSSRHAR